MTRLSGPDQYDSETRWQSMHWKTRDEAGPRHITVPRSPSYLPDRAPYDFSFP